MEAVTEAVLITNKVPFVVAFEKTVDFQIQKYQYDCFGEKSSPQLSLSALFTNTILDL